LQERAAIVTLGHGPSILWNLQEMCSIP
jgi:hypothetical protein